MQNRKPKIAVLFGGASKEHDVSLKSAYAVLSALDEDRYEVLKVGIDRSGEWYLYTGPTERVAQGRWLEEEPVERVRVSTNSETRGLVCCDSGRLVSVDAALPLLHGVNGEDGSVQGLLSLGGIPVVGCGIAGSAICIDKVLSHRIAQTAGVPIAKMAMVTQRHSPAQIAAAAEEVGYPLYVKPAREGSSFGLHRVADEHELAACVADSFTFDDRLIIEKEIDGKEIGCALLEAGNELIVGELDEIVLNGSVFDYHEKYSCETADIIVPARLGQAQRQAVIETARFLFRLFGCTGIARIDFFLGTDGTLYFNEANTVPGFTAHSRYPRMLEAAGLSFPGLLETIIDGVVG